MRKIILFLIWFIFVTQIVFALNISVNPWESKSISFPQELEYIHFSKDSNFSVKTLEWWIWKDVWNNLSNYHPLRWYIISNFSWDVLNIDYKYKSNISLSNSLVQRKLPAWWNLVWVCQKNDEQEKIKAIFGFGYSLPFSQMIDFTSSDFAMNNTWNKLDSVFHIYWKSQANSKYVFENKAYAIFNNVDSMYSWVQNYTDSNGNVIYDNNDEDDNSWYEEDDDEFNNWEFELEEQWFHSRSILLASWIEAVVYKAKLSVYYNDIFINNLKLKLSSDSTLSQKLNEIIQSVTLNIGWQIFNWNINESSIDFSWINKLIQKNTSNTELLVTFVFKNNDLIKDWEIIKMELESISLKGSDWKDLLPENIDIERGWIWEIILKTNVILNVKNYHSSSKLVLWWTKDEDIFDLHFSSDYWNSKIEALYFANDYDGDEWIDADINSEIINNIRLEQNWVVIWTWILNNWKLKFENLNAIIKENDNSYKDNSLKIIVDFPEIDSDSKTNKKIRFVLTDIKAKTEINNKKIEVVNNEYHDNWYEIDDWDWEYLLSDDIWEEDIAWSRITTRKSTFKMNNLPLENLDFGYWDYTVYKWEITASWWDIELSSLNFNFHWFLNNIKISNLTRSWSVIIDSNWNEIMSNFDLYIWGQKVNSFTKTNKWPLDKYFYISPEWLIHSFEPIKIDSWETKSIELKIHFSNIKENDYFYVTTSWLVYSDLSAWVNHSNISQDWFYSGVSSGNVYTLTK